MANYYINKAKAINALNEAQIEFDENYKGLGKAKQIIENLPTITITGNWIIDINDKNYCFCQFCKYKFDVDHLKMVWGTYEFPPYCPNCGAEMDTIER